MIARRVLVSILNNVLGAVLGLVALNFVTAYGGKAAWGSWVYGLAVVSLVGFLASFGFHVAHVKYVSEGRDEGVANATYLTLKVALTAGYVVATLLGILLWTEVLGETLRDLSVGVLVLALLYNAALSLRHVFDYSFQAHRLIALAESVLLVDTIVTVVAVSTVALAIGWVNGLAVPLPEYGAFAASLLRIEGPVSPGSAAIQLGFAYVVGKIVSFAYAGFQFVRHRFPLGRPNWATIRVYAAFAFPVAIAGILVALTQQIDRAFLGYFWTASEVADYNLAAVLLSPMFIVSTALGMLLFPTVSRLDADGDLTEMGALLARADRYLSMLLVPQVMLAVVFAPEAARVITSGGAFAGAVPVIRILTVFVFFNSILTTNRSLLLGRNQPRLLARLGVLNAVIVVGLNLLFIPTSILGIPLLGLGASGAAIVAGVQGVASYAYLRYHTREWMPYVLPPGLTRQAIAAGLAGVALWALRDGLPPGFGDRLWELAAAGALGALLYGVVLWLVRGFTGNDARFILDLAHPGKFGRYVGSELRRRRE